MAVVQIPNLPVAVGLSGDEQLEIVQAGTSKRTSVQAVSNFANPIPQANYTTIYQFMCALSATPGIDSNLLYQAIESNFENTATIQFWFSPYILPGSPLETVVVATYPGIDLIQVYADAQFYPQWG